MNRKIIGGIATLLPKKNTTISYSCRRNIAFLCALRLSPYHIVADVFGFALRDRAVDGDVKLRGRIDAVQILFFKVHIHLDFPQHSGDLDAVEGVSGKAADGFDDDHIYPASFALADQLIELIALSHTGAGDTFVGVSAYQLPAGFSVNPFCVVVHLIFITVKLFVLLGGHSAVSGHPLGNALRAVGIHRLYGRGDGANSLL